MILHKTTLILLPLLAKTAFPVTFYTEMHFLALLSPLNGQGWTAGVPQSLSHCFTSSTRPLMRKVLRFVPFVYRTTEMESSFFLRFNSSISHVMSWFSIPECNLNLLILYKCGSLSLSHCFTSSTRPLMRKVLRFVPFVYRTTEMESSFFLRFNSSISHVMSWFSISACNLNLFCFRKSRFYP